VSQRIARGAISNDLALPAPKQIAEALELKPRPQGPPDDTMEVLDFGSPKVLERLRKPRRVRLVGIADAHVAGMKRAWMISRHRRERVGCADSYEGCLMNIGIVVGTRPHVGKIYSLQKAVKELSGTCRILHTNQHYDYEMQQLLFDELGYAPDEVMEKYSIGNAIDWVARMIKRHRLDFVFLQGDSAPALVGTVAAIYSDIGIGHMESGLRANDSLMIEERNRVIADSASHYLFCYCEEHAENLRSSKYLRGKIFVVGNPTVDLINQIRPRFHVHERGTYLYVTLHRRELTENT
jgi:hypothetical protein